MKFIPLLLLLVLLAGCGFAPPPAVEYATKDDLNNAYESLQKSDIARYDTALEKINDLASKIEVISNKQDKATKNKDNSILSAEIEDAKIQVSELKFELNSIKNAKPTNVVTTISTDEVKNKLSEFSNQITSAFIKINSLEDRLTKLTTVVENMANSKNSQSENESISKDNSDAKAHTVASWVGNGQKTTEPFTITKSPWGVAWEARSNNDSAPILTMSITLYKSNGELVSLVANTTKPGSDISFVYNTGTFYLEISALFADWTVVVRELK
jgi:hypothetical protein